MKDKIQETNPDFKLEADDNLLSLLPPIQGSVQPYSNIFRQNQQQMHTKSKESNSKSQLGSQSLQPQFTNSERYEKEVNRLQGMIQKQKLINNKLQRQNKDPVFQPIEIEHIFMNCIENVKQKFIEDDDKETQSMTMNQQRHNASKINRSQ